MMSELEAAEEFSIINDAVFNDLRKTCAELARGQSAQCVEIAQDKFGLVKRADEIFPGGEVHADFAADGAIDLREERGGHLHEIDAAQISGGHESGEIADHSAAEGDHKRTSLDAVFGQLIVTGLHIFQRLGFFAGGLGNENGLEAGGLK